MSEFVDRDVKIVYVVDNGGEYKLETADADINDAGVAVFNAEIDGQNTLVTRPAGHYLTYLEFKKISNNLYNKAVKLAKEKVKNG